jgi:hypothetical protein
MVYLCSSINASTQLERMSIVLLCTGVHKNDNICNSDFLSLVY